MLGASFTYYFVLGPFILFAIDQLISVSRRKITIPVVEATLLPSGNHSAVTIYGVILSSVQKVCNYIYSATPRRAAAEHPVGVTSVY